MWAMGGAECPLITSSKGGPVYFAMGASINTKEDLSVFAWRREKRKEGKFDIACCFSPILYN